MKNYFFYIVMLSVLLISCGEEKPGLWKGGIEIIPGKEELALKLPEKNSNLREMTATGETSDFYLQTRQVTDDVNLGVLNMLSFFDEILAYPPTKSDENHAEWGPWKLGGLSPLEGFVEITKKEDGNYTYSFNIRPKTGGEWLTWFSGLNNYDGKSARKGKGYFTVNFDNLKKYDPATDESGEVKVSYDTVTSGRDIVVAFINFQGKNDKAPVNATYNFKENKDMSGQFIFTVKGNIHADNSEYSELTKEEDWTFTTKWLSDGKGRSDISVIGGDINDMCYQSVCAGKYLASECWDSSFITTFSSESVYSTQGELWGEAKTAGDKSACPF